MLRLEMYRVSTNDLDGFNVLGKIYLRHWYKMKACIKFKSNIIKVGEF
jgi:hypothetical protein